MAQVAGQIGDLSENSLKPLISHVDEIIMRIGNNTDRQPGGAVHQPAGDRHEVQNKTPKITDDISTIHHSDERHLAAGRQVVDDQNIQSVRNILAKSRRPAPRPSAAAAEIKWCRARLQTLTDQVERHGRRQRKNVDKSVANLEYILRSVAQNIDSITATSTGRARNMSEFSR
jgi:phospholipid/cholesterol/gamma-HCH transport system substrate-binding protein